MELTMQSCWLGTLVTGLPAVMKSLTETPDNQLGKLLPISVVITCGSFALVPRRCKHSSK